MASEREGMRTTMTEGRDDDSDRDDNDDRWEWEGYDVIDDRGRRG